MKYIEVVAETEQTLTQLCDAALKGSGFAAHVLVNKLIASIKDDGKPVVQVEPPKE